MNIEKNVNLQPYNTFQFPCVADYFVAIESIEQFQELRVGEIFKKEKKKLYLGGGSNILLTSNRFDGLVIKNEILGKEVISETPSRVTLRVGGGENWDQFVHWSINQGYCGVENLVSIPGSVGAAPMQNIGAYGIEAKSVIQSVEYIDCKSGKTKTLQNNECEFGYRHSIFKKKLKDKVFITHVIFVLKKYNQLTYAPHVKYGAIQEKLEKVHTQITPQIVAETIASIRASKLPDWSVLGTAGSFFKNPIIKQSAAKKVISKHEQLVSFPAGEGYVKFSAGQLIDLAGCKGMIQGNVGTYGSHALVLIHIGGGSGEEIVALAEHIQETVKNLFNITLIPEVNYIL